jgi:hypothetical protein
MSTEGVNTAENESLAELNANEDMIRDTPKENEENDNALNDEGVASPPKKSRRTRRELPVSIWYEACQKFMKDSGKYKGSQATFLRSPDSGILDESNRMSFSKRLREFKNGNLPQESSIKRVRKGKYHDVEQCLIAFIETRTKFSKGKTAVTWPFLIELAKRFAVALGYSEKEFRASPGWLQNVLKRNKKSLNDDINDDDVLVYLDLIKKYCKKNELGRVVETKCDQLGLLLRKELKRDDEASPEEDKEDEQKFPQEPPGIVENQRTKKQPQRHEFPPVPAVPFWPHTNV